MKSKMPVFVVLALCLGSTVALAADQASFDKAYEAAVAAQQKAASVSGEWRDTAKMLKEAKKKAEEGDFEGAIKLAKQAEHQGHRGYEQMTSQAGNVGLDPFLQ